MKVYPDGPNGAPEATPEQVAVAKVPKPADVSLNTMGGLHIFSTEQKGNASIIPLSAKHFLQVGEYSGQNPGSGIHLPLVKTIVAIDPSVATPVSAAEQVQLIQAERRAYVPSYISATPASGSAPLTITFTPGFLGLGGHPVDFGDGTNTEATCAEFKPDTDACIRMNTLTHIYTKPGTYTVIYKDLHPEKVWGTVTIVVN